VTVVSLIYQADDPSLCSCNGHEAACVVGLSMAAETCGCTVYIG